MPSDEPMHFYMVLGVLCLIAVAIGALVWTCRVDHRKRRDRISRRLDEITAQTDMRRWP